jgi:SAM-dependent methyltransferase
MGGKAATFTKPACPATTTHSSPVEVARAACNSNETARTRLAVVHRTDAGTRRSALDKLKPTTPKYRVIAMDLRNGLRNALPHTYRRVDLGYNAVRLFGSILRRKVDFVMLRDVTKNAKGTSKKECPLCGFTGFFKAFGSPPRWDAQCPSCYSLERHRLFALFLNNTPSVLTNGAAVLHFAPEDCIRTLLQKPSIQYTSADLSRADVDLNVNIEDINIGNGQYDVVVCNHVLEHVNDKAALSELRRVLKSDGVLIVTVPIIDGCDTTYEDDTIRDSESRLIHFGQEDHVRVYGADFIRRLISAGFQVKVHTAFGKEAVKFGLTMGEKIFLCTKADLQ